MAVSALPGALCAGVAVGSLVLVIARPRRRLGPRVEDYTLVARSKLGSGPGVLSLAREPSATTAGAMVRVLRPMFDVLAHLASALAGIQDDDALALQLRRAGVRGLSPRRYRQQQVLLAIVLACAGALLGALVGLAVGREPTVLGAVLGLCGFVLGTVWRTATLARRVRERRLRMRSELYSLCQVMAIYARATPSLLQITEHVSSRSRGELAGEMREVLRRIETGATPEAAFAEAARLTAEPAAARLYRTMATAAEAGGDIAETLLAQSEDVRDAKREETKQLATKRRGATLAPLVLLLAPIMLLFVVAPIPRMVLGL